MVGILEETVTPNPSVQRTGANRWDHYLSGGERRLAPAVDAGRSPKRLCAC